jgi:hypothetical protein
MLPTRDYSGFHRDGLYRPRAAIAGKTPDRKTNHTVIRYRQIVEG